jgi:hypothetical protein
MQPQLLTAEDEENYGTALIDMTQRAAREVMAPEIQQLRAENQQLRHLQQRQQHVEIERTLDARVPNWRSIYSDPAFAQWLSLADPYSDELRSRLMGHAVATGDSNRVVSFYQGFLAEAGAPRGSSPRGGYQSRRTASGNIYSRAQVADLYKRRRDGHIGDEAWTRQEADIIAAGREGRIVGAVGPDGTAVSRWAR